MSTHHKHSRPLVHKHAHGKHRYAYSHAALCAAHADSALELSSAGRYSTLASHLGSTAKVGTDCHTSVASNSALEHRQEMGRMWSKLYAAQLHSEGRVSAEMMWLEPAQFGEETVSSILATHSGLPSELVH